MLFSRYADPMTVVDRMIRTGRFAEFVREFIRIRNEELEAQTKWEFWLHKVYDMTYQEFLDRVDGAGTVKENKPSQHELQMIVSDSWGTLNSFCPE